MKRCKVDLDPEVNQIPSSNQSAATRVLRTVHKRKENVHKIKTKCKHCDISFHPHSITYHMRSYHNDLIRCSYYNCSTYFRSEEESQKHQDLVHSNRKQRKSKVPLEDEQKSQLPIAKVKRSAKMTKLKQPEDVVKYQFNCVYCNKFYSNKTTLHCHVKSSHADIKIRCKIYSCFQYFYTQTDYDVHFERVHRKIEDKKRYSCSKCYYKTNIIVHLKTHFAHMHGPRNLMCPKCTKYFGSVKALKYHYKTHERPKKCEHCNGDFANLRDHQRKERCKTCQQHLLCIGMAMQHSEMCNSTYA